MAIKTEASGERVVIDPAFTYQRIYMIFYWCINLGSLSLIATPFMEKYEGFWTAYLMCFIMFNLGVAVLVARRKTYVNRPPQGSVITDAFKALGLMIMARNTDAAKPSWRAANGKTKIVPWNDHFVDELKRALRACKVFVFCKPYLLASLTRILLTPSQIPSSGSATASSPPTSSPKLVRCKATACPTISCRTSTPSPSSSSHLSLIRSSILSCESSALSYDP